MYKVYIVFKDGGEKTVRFYDTAHEAHKACQLIDQVSSLFTSMRGGEYLCTEMAEVDPLMSGSESRYFVDERAGIVAVRDRLYTDPDYRGLHADTDGVIQAWYGVPYCQTDDRMTYWTLDENDLVDAVSLCNMLNRGRTTYTPSSEWRQYRCYCGCDIEWDDYTTFEGVCQGCGMVYK